MWALSDLHLGNRDNRELFATLPLCPDDWLILAGDIGETELHLRLALEMHSWGMLEHLFLGGTLLLLELSLLVFSQAGRRW